jgi:hypothetical protein
MNVASKDDSMSLLPVFLRCHESCPNGSGVSKVDPFHLIISSSLICLVLVSCPKLLDDSMSLLPVFLNND